MKDRTKLIAERALLRKLKDTSSIGNLEQQLVRIAKLQVKVTHQRKNSKRKNKSNTWQPLRKYLRANGITYQEYLDSPHWKDIRKRFWASKLHDNKCGICGNKEALQVHHKTYQRIGNEKLHDFELLCGKCHKGLHIEASNAKGPSLKKVGKHLYKKEVIENPDGVRGKLYWRKKAERLKIKAARKKKKEVKRIKKKEANRLRKRKESK